MGSAKLATVGIEPNAFNITTIIQDYENGHTFRYSVENLLMIPVRQPEYRMTLTVCDYEGNNDISPAGVRRANKI